MIVDCHCHAGKGDIMTAPWNTDAPIEHYLRRARAAGIAKTVVFPLFHSDYGKANAELARIITRYPSRLIGFAFVHATRDAGRIFSMVERAVKEWGFRGIKVHGHEAMATREVCETARAFRLPVLLDVAGQAHVIDMLAPQFPDVNFIIPHLGSFADDWRVHQRVVDQLVRFPNVYGDTSAVRRFDYIVQAVQRAGAHKVLFGSDGPWLHPGVELQKIRLLRLPPDAEALILSGNILRLLRHGQRGQMCNAAGWTSREIEFEAENRNPAVEAATWSGEVGPGRWERNITGGSGTEADRRYQRQITGRPTSFDYRVTRGSVSANFDGYRRGILLDAKNLPSDGGMVRMYQWMQTKNSPPPEPLRAWADQQVEAARRQVRVADGIPVVWHVSSADGARVIRRLLATHNLLSQNGTGGIVVTVTRSG
jgi:predicted TIM-barrel fold metal-dependent hydrolase